jgi:putative FmdB family regulatory protein
MPLFEYRCTACEAEFEELVGSAASAVTCRRCGSPRVSRLLSTFAVGGGAGGAAARAAEPGPCGACGAPQRGMCGEG